MTGYPYHLIIVFALIGAVIAGGCVAFGGEDTSTGHISGNGTVTYVDLEGGFYGIVADDGERYLPENLPEDYRQDGLRVTFDADIVNDTATIQQWGTPIEIVSVTKGDTRRAVSGTGTVTYVDLEGGFYGIIADDGERYLPTNLAEDYRVDGLRVRFSADVEEDTAGFQMWGTQVTILTIERIDGVRYVSGNGTVTYVDLEGGFYVITADDGACYLPLGLNEIWQVDGMNVTFIAKVKEDTVTYQMCGTPVEVLAIERAGNATFVAGTGTVTYVDLEGGFYGIVADDGKCYLPLEFDERYRINGTEVTFAGKVARDTMTIQQWGTPIEILDISSACTRCGGSVGIANPAAVWCTEQGHTYEIRKNPDGSEYGVCIFENGTEIDAWDYYRETH